MARKSPSNSLAAHVQRLEEQQAQLKQEMAEAERELRKKPRVNRSSPSPDKRVRLNNIATIAHPQPLGHRVLGENAGLQTRSRRKRQTRREVRRDKILFMLLCLVLIVIAIFVAHNLFG